MLTKVPGEFVMNDFMTNSPGTPVSITSVSASATVEGDGRRVMLRIAVVDDEEAARELYGSLARDWARRRGVEAEVVTFASAEQLLFSLDDAPCDVVLLDIEMPGLDGMALARELRSRGERAQIVFVTGVIDHALDGYDVDAVSYLLKPARREARRGARPGTGSRGQGGAHARGGGRWRDEPRAPHAHLPSGGARP